MNNTCPCANPETNKPANTLTKIYYPVNYKRNNYTKNNETTENVNSPKSLNSSNILQYYYNNINNNDITTNSNDNYLSKQSTININNIFATSNNQPKIILEKNHLSSTKRPLAITRSSPSNFFMKTFRSDSQKRPLLLNYPTYHSTNLHGPNFKIVPDKTGLKISPIYSISQDVDRYVPRKRHSSYFRNARVASSCRPLYVKK